MGDQPLDLSDNDLEKQFTPSKWSPYAESEEVIRDYISEIIRGTTISKYCVKCTADVSYGETEKEKLDIYGCEKLPEDAPIFVFLHGGYWIEGRREISSFFVKPMCDAGILCMVMGYDLVNEKVSLTDVITGIQRGVKYIIEYSQEKQSKGLFFAGHSAGAHLISIALSSPPFEIALYKKITGVILISGIYELTPLLKTSYGPAAHITKEIADTCSPLRCITNLQNRITLKTPILIVTGEYDSPSFKTQSTEYFQALKVCGFQQVEYLVIENKDHFNVLHKLSDKEYELSQKLIEFVKKHSHL